MPNEIKLKLHDHSYFNCLGCTVSAKKNITYLLPRLPKRYKVRWYNFDHFGQKPHSSYFLTMLL